jgi:hypothetical protein
MRCCPQAATSPACRSKHHRHLRIVISRQILISMDMIYADSQKLWIKQPARPPGLVNQPASSWVFLLTRLHQERAQFALQDHLVEQIRADEVNMGQFGPNTKDTTLRMSDPAFKRSEMNRAMYTRMGSSDPGQAWPIPSLPVLSL